jgi:hypothetical protein
MTKTSLRALLVSMFALAFSAAIAVPALADAAQRVPLPDFSLEGANACTGNLTTITFTNQTILIHDDVDPTGREHLAITRTGDIATDDGFSGRFVFTGGQNVQGPIIEGEFRGFLDLTNATFTLQNDSGQVLLVHGVSHVTIPSGSTGELTGEVEILRVECLGNPS